MKQRERESDFNKNLHSHFYHFNNIVIAIAALCVYTQNIFHDDCGGGTKGTLRWIPAINPFNYNIFKIIFVFLTALVLFITLREMSAKIMFFGVALRLDL